jgi:chorismate mutase/prephenate dehydratase
MFIDSDVQVCAQVLLRIEHHLLSRSNRENIVRVYSHPQAFAQTRNWLRRNFPGIECVEVSSTTRAAECAAKEPGAAAIAGKLAGEMLGLNIVESAIQDSADNTTRFLVIGMRPSPATGNDRTSLLFSVAHEPGALYRALEPFHTQGINIGKIESRPSRRKAWEYCFFLDVDGHALDPALERVLDELRQRCTQVKILGTFPVPMLPE